MSDNKKKTLEIDIKDLQKRSVFIGTPMYGGMCSGYYNNSCIELAKMLNHYGIKHVFYSIFNESLITRARNYIADEFMRQKEFSHLLFIDADIGFNPNDVISLLAISDPESDKDIVCGPYPKKCISWEKIKAAVDKGFADNDPNVLENFVGDFVFNPAPNNNNQIRLDEPIEVLESGTGFMMIQRKAFEMYNEAYPELLYTPDHVRTKYFDGSRQIMCYFDAVIDQKAHNFYAELKKLIETKSDLTGEEILDFFQNPKSSALGKNYSDRYLSEDYLFCQKSREAGVKTWLCPWMELKHMGSYIFGGGLRHLASIDAAATADVNKLGSKR